MGSAAASTNEIKKHHLEEMVLFAINNIPDIDPVTLERFMELVNTGGNFGKISHKQILRKMHQVLKYIPNACGQSLLILMDLLEIKSFDQLALTGSHVGSAKMDMGKQRSRLLLLEPSRVMAGESSEPYFR